MFEKYKKYCDTNKEKHIPQRIFNADLKRLGFSSKKRKQGMVWFAIIGSSDNSNTSSSNQVSKNTQKYLDILNT